LNCTVGSARHPSLLWPRQSCVSIDASAGTENYLNNNYFQVVTMNGSYSGTIAAYRERIRRGIDTISDAQGTTISEEQLQDVLLVRTLSLLDAYEDATTRWPKSVRAAAYFGDQLHCYDRDQLAPSLAETFTGYPYRIAFDFSPRPDRIFMLGTDFATNQITYTSSGRLADYAAFQQL
jgi:hypothetical protein